MAEEDREEQTPTAPASQKPLSKRILLVDDDAEIVDAMRYALEAKG
jgi:PleD family two-component response regulator